MGVGGGGCYLKNNNSSLQKFSKAQVSTEFWVPFCDTKSYKILQSKLDRQAGTKMSNVCIIFVKQNSEVFYGYLFSPLIVRKFHYEMISWQNLQKADGNNIWLLLKTYWSPKFIRWSLWSWIAVLGNFYHPVINQKCFWQLIWETLK